MFWSFVLLCFDLGLTVSMILCVAKYIHKLCTNKKINIYIYRNATFYIYVNFSYINDSSIAIISL